MLCTIGVWLLFKLVIVDYSKIFVTMGADLEELGQNTLRLQGSEGTRDGFRGQCSE